MKRFRARFTTRSLMIGVALVGLNLAGAIATAKHHQGRPSSRGRLSPPFSKMWTSIVRKEGRGIKHPKSFVFEYFNGTIEIGHGRYGSPRQEIKRIVLAPPAPTTFQIWSPLITSLLLTMMVLVIPRAHPGLRRRGIDSIGGSLLIVRPRRLWPAVRWLMIVLALAGLNLVATHYRPALDPYDDQFESPLRSTADLLVKPDGGLEIRPIGGKFLVMKPEGFRGFQSFGGRLALNSDRSVVSQASSDSHDLSSPYGDDRGRLLGTIVYKPDGSIVGYEGRPGEMRAPPHVIRPPLRSFLEMWWPVMASASITLLVLGLLGRQLWGQRADLVTQEE